VGLMRMGGGDDAAKQSLRKATQDSCGEVGVMAAWALLKGGETALAEEALQELLKRDEATQLFALNALDWMQADLAKFRPAIDRLATTESRDGYVERMALDLGQLRRRK